ncbi:MAG: GNAT family N-acetyltransferase [Candidatus Niyogibacteria bacterium]|nr:GNAT family N-acetyltransferase [Candidatus Niyogibacteria bacterium]
MITLMPLKVLRVNERHVRDIRTLCEALAGVSLGQNFRTVEAVQVIQRQSALEVWCAFDGDALVGMAGLIVADLFMGKRAFIEEVAVHPAYQGKGIGRSLVDQLIALARHAGCLCVDLTSNPQRIAANALYQRLGFRRRTTNVYRLDLSEKPPHS